jgi:hypothetical protein
MNKDQVVDKVRDVAGGIERQTGEWTGDKEKEVRRNVKNLGRRATDKKANEHRHPVDDSVEAEVEREIEEEVCSRRKVS